MRQQLDTAPVLEAYNTKTECPFCHLERQAEQRSIRYALGPGASYMEPDVRADTDRQGFCRHHLKSLMDYGNNLGNALVLQTYFVGLIKELDAEIDAFTPPAKRPLLGKSSQPRLPIARWAQQKTESCFLCSRIDYHMNRYYATFFHLIKDAEFRQKVESGSGFCLHHFLQLLDKAPELLPNAQLEWFYDTVLPLMRQNLARVQGDLDWFIEKFDYRNASAPWKNSQDAVQRAMQKIRGGYAADKPYKMD